MDQQNVGEHTVEYYSAIKRNAGLIHAMKWRKLENIMLSEGSQTQEVTRCMIPLTRNV